MTHRRAVRRAIQAASRPPELVHHIPHDYPGRGYAVAICGTPVHDRREQPGRIVTCPDCLTEQRRYDRLDLGQPRDEDPMNEMFGNLPGDPEPDDEELALGADTTPPASVADMAADLSRSSVELGRLLEQQGRPRITLPRETPPGVSYDIQAGDDAHTPVLFPVLAAGATVMAFEQLEEPGRRVAELVEALEPVLAPPAALAQLEALITRAKTHTTTDAASYKTAGELYELICANEKGIEQNIDPVVAFFYRPWKAMTTFRAKLAKPLSEVKASLSRESGEWKRLDNARIERERRADAEREAQKERDRLAALAREEEARRAAAAAAQQPLVAAEAAANVADIKEAITQVVPTAKPAAAFGFAPSSGGTRGKKSYECVVDDELALYKAIAEGKASKSAAPLDLGFLKRQANDHKDDFAKLFPGCRAIEVGGLAKKPTR